MTTAKSDGKHERRSVATSERGPGISPEERRKLATCCAFFKAARYRPAGPGTLRESDVREAEQAITQAIVRCTDARDEGAAS